MRRYLTRCVTALTILLAATSLAGCSSDDNGTEPIPALVATWDATSFNALGQDFVDQGMTFRLTLTASGTYTIEITGDLIDMCDGADSCSAVGTYSATTTQVTFDPLTAEAVTLSYTIQGATLTFTGNISGVPASIVLVKA